MERAKLTGYERLTYRLEMERQDLANEVAYWLGHSDAYWPSAWRGIGRAYGRMHALAEIIERLDADYWQASRKSKEEAA